MGEIMLKAIGAITLASCWIGTKATEVAEYTGSTSQVVVRIGSYVFEVPSFIIYLVLGFFVVGIVASTLITIKIYKWVRRPTAVQQRTVANKSARTMSTQSQVKYSWWYVSPRFQPLTEREHGAWIV